jgi:cyclic beta-1,2-glucan synthetase
MQVTLIDIPQQAKPSAEIRLQRLAHQLAGNHSAVESLRHKVCLLKHLQSWKQTLQDAYACFRDAPSKDIAFSRAAEWMLDNFYIVEQTLYQIEQDLPQSYFDQLPKLYETILKGYPRIFALGWEWVRYNQCQLDLIETSTFMQDYQQITPLTTGELWALPTMLRIAILERLAIAVAAITGIDTPETPQVLPNLPLASTTTNETIVANCFLGLRLLSETDWKTFLEQISHVEKILREDPSGIYPSMDFNTRNIYRSVIEELARHSIQGEESVAQIAIEFAHNAKDKSQATKQNPDRKLHVGFYLIDAGRSLLEKSINYRPGLKAGLRRWFLAHPVPTFLGSIGLLSLLIVLGLLSYVYAVGGSLTQLIIVGLLGSALAVDAAVDLVNWIVMHEIRPHSLPRMDFSEGIPTDFRTMVVIPTLLANAKELDSLLQELELHFLRNPDPQLTFALLADFNDAPAQLMPEDEKLLAAAKAGIDNLNHKYSQTAPFYLFHRQREWNPSEEVWMGWERKRGKLAEFNRLLLDAGQTSYTTQVGDLSILPEIKYVITLDADTSLPQDSARRLIATLAHPLNRAEFAADGCTVCAGYTVLQPRVKIKPTSTNRSLFSQIYTGNAGFDLYTLAISDVYQDLFGEGSYVGKGIYDVEAFERSLKGKVRENTLLSHDLLEGIFGHAALVTDVILYEEYPAGYLTHARRLRRWIRGDWQLLPWLFPSAQIIKGIASYQLSIIDRWKIIDNLRRSLLAPAYLALFAAGWLVLPGSPLLWTLLVLLTPALPIAVQGLQNVRQKIGRSSFKDLIEPTRLPAMRWALAIIFLPYEALLALSAVGITLFRLFIARKHMLQWTTAAESALSFINTRCRTWWEMAASNTLNALLGIAIVMINPSALLVAVPLLLAWIISPQVAFWISRPIQHISSPIYETQRKQLQRLARRTWAYFEQYAGPDDHWLPADHFQESPRGDIAHYTTPTNIGLFLLSALSAYDLGYIGLLELSVRLRSAFENIDKLEHYHGHLLNWYNTSTLAALPPHYISTVDSGNLAACLIALRQGCLALTDAPLVRGQQWQGLLVILDILTEILKELEKNNPARAIKSFEVELDGICERVTAIQNKPEVWMAMLSWISGEGWESVSHRLLELLEGPPSNLNPEILSELRLYLDTLRHHLAIMQRNFELFTPWLNRLNQLPTLFSQAGNPLAQAWQGFRDSLPIEFPRLRQAASVYIIIQTALSQLRAQLNDNSGSTEQIQEARAWCQRLDDDLSSARMAVGPLLISYSDLAGQVNAIVNAMDFKFLFDEQRQVFHIGYNASTERLDTSYYDLLASEARIASLIAIAKGDVPQSHWLHLGRPITKVDGKLILLSWSGTMFEYLMPGLLIKNYEGTFLSDSCYAAIDAQRSYAQHKHIPWGISESGYLALDANLNYQYRAFGVPDLGIKRDVPKDLVVAPYASLLGLSLQPQAVLANMTRLENLHMLGRFGFYEAIDYTETHLPSEKQPAAVQSYMAHHQGMILLAVCNYFSKDGMVRRFHADERVRSIELLLQEKIPQDPHIEYPHPEETVELHSITRSVDIAPWRVPIDSPIPQVHFLAQGRYGVLITNAGSGYSQWQEFALTRWQADTTLDHWGTWIYLQDRENGEYWSVTCQPTGYSPDNQEVLYSPHMAEFRRWDHGISLRTEVTVGGDEVEIRRVTLLNDSDHPRRLKLTSYSEVVLSPQATDQRHPAFNKLFIESEYLPDGNALLFNRRPRSPDEKPVYMAHALVVEPGHKATREYESDRAPFLGRGRTQRSPLVLEGMDTHLSGTVGGTLDPIMSLAQEIDLKPHTHTQITFLTLAAASRAEALDLVTRYQSGRAITRAFDEARLYSENELIELGLNANSVEHIQQLLSALLYSVNTLRAAADIVVKNEKGQSGLWAYAISGDYPILLVHVLDGTRPLLQETLQAYAYWRNRQVKVTLVILNDQDTGYAMDLHTVINDLISRMGATEWLNQRGGIFLFRTDQIPKTDVILLETVAGVVLDDQMGTLAEHASLLTRQPIRLPGFTPALPVAQDPEPTPPLARPLDLHMDNGLGRFSLDGKEYVIYLNPGQHTPHPWINVVANPQFGFLVSEAGGGCTWAGNSGENRLTPWRNDPLTDMPGEALYLRDEETGLVWSPTPMPAGAETTHVIRHGAGYSVFESQSHGLNQILRLFAAPDAPVKIVHLRLQNLWERPRRITVTYYAEWVLGTTRDISQAYIIPEFEPDKNALLASNHFNTEFGERVAFLAANKKLHGLTADRTEFLGRTGSMSAPAALGRIGLGSAVHAGLDPCAAIQLHVDLAPGQVEEVYFLLGEDSNREESLTLIGEYQAQAQVESAWQAVHKLWGDILGTITVQTPDPGMDLMLNRWLLYQTLGCRLWGRTALYQSSGAFGFRDQLQDVLALMHARPDLTREQIINAAQHQFEAGDVLHWWNPPSGRGVRTRFSDDLLWLPFVTADYVTATGDQSILTEKIPFLKAEPLKSEEADRYSQYESTAEVYTLYEHCRRALEKGSTAGIHGLPLMGEGDWNDGMNRVGVEGRGESVWLGWFLHATLMRFAVLCELMNNDPEPYRQQAERLSQALEAHAWDGNWYLRAFYDDGSLLGSSKNPECQIDSIAQSWAVLSGAADPARALQAMESVNKLLIKQAEQLILLLTPPFDKTPHDPGYIKGYLSGVRENGGQYTHAAIWSVWAYASLGQGDRAQALYRLLNPIYHSDTPEKAARYKTEPYNIAADIYSVSPHTGNGGWTGYTGSAGWMYRLGMEAILGVSRIGNILKINPCIPRDWPGYKLTYQFDTTLYLISVENPDGVNQGVQRVVLDGKTLTDNRIPLSRDGEQHKLQVRLGQTNKGVG